MNWNDIFFNFCLSSAKKIRYLKSLSLLKYALPTTIINNQLYIYTSIYTPDTWTDSILYMDSVSTMIFSLFLYHYTNYFTHLRCIVIHTCCSIILMVIDNFSSYNLLTLLSNFNFAFCVLILIYMYSLIFIFILF